MSWSVDFDDSPKLKNPVLLVGLPGVGGVGKLVVDFLIDKLDAKKLATLFSPSLPNVSFISDDNLLELPTIELFYKKTKNKDFLFLAGEVQPTDETSCYEFCKTILNILKNNNGKEIITLGGIALKNVPEKVNVYCTGNSKNAVKKFSKGAKTKLYGFVGPIMGVSGVLPAIALSDKIDGVVFLSETLGHPMYLGIEAAKALLDHLNNIFNFKISSIDLDAQMKKIQNDFKVKLKELKLIPENKKNKTETTALDEEASYIV